MYHEELFLSKLYNVERNIFRGVILSHWRVMQYLKKNWLAVWKMTRNFVNFHGNSRKSENLHFYGLLLSIACKVLTKKVQTCYLSWQWWLIQTLKKNELFVWKMTRGNWLILTRAVDSLKIWTMIDYFCWKYVMFELNKYRGVVLRKMTYGFKNNIRNLVNK